MGNTPCIFRSNDLVIIKFNEQDTDVLREGEIYCE